MKRTPKFNRRSFLRGMLGGAAVAIGMPPLEAFLNAHGTAYADTGPSGFPKRYIQWYWGNGHLAEKWNPAATGKGDAWAISDELAPLAAFKQKMSVMTGYDVPFNGVGEPHFETACRLLVGKPLLMTGDDWTFSGETFDQRLAASLGKGTRFSSLEVGCENKRRGLSYFGPNKQAPAETSPFAFFERVFGGGFSLPGEGGGPDPRLALERSVLDVVTADLEDLKKEVGAADQIRLEQHLDGIRALEKQLAILADPPELAACAYPDTPLTEYGEQGGLIPWAALNEANAKIAAYALACDQTRVVSHWFSAAVQNSALFPERDESHHSLTHFEQDPQPEVHECMLFCMENLATFVGALDAIEEGDGTLLDHSVVFATSDCASGKLHSGTDFPLLLIGGADGALVTDMHHRSTAGENATRVMLTIARALGVDMPSFGEDEQFADTPISELLA